MLFRQNIYIFVASATPCVSKICKKKCHKVLQRHFLWIYFLLILQFSWIPEELLDIRQQHQWYRQKFLRVE
jgi:hypothetical protein